MISSLELTNWRSHGDTTLEFGKGTNLLIGMMGAGKSSVLDAITFALFGTYPALEHRKTRLEEIIRENKEQAKISLAFAWNGSNYRVERLIKRGKRSIGGDAEIYKNNSLVDKSPSSVNAYIENLLSIDYDLFTRAIYSEQNNIDYFLTVDPRRRKGEMDILLGLDKFETARANAVAVINRIKGERKTLETKFDPNKLEATRKMASEKKERAHELEKQAKEKNAEIVKLREIIERLHEIHSQLLKKKIFFENLNKRKNELAGSIHILKKQIGEKVADEKFLEELLIRKNRLEQSSTAAEKKLNILDNEIRMMTKELATIENSIKTTERNIAEAEILKNNLASILGGKTIGQWKAELKKCEETILLHNTEQRTLTTFIQEMQEIAITVKDDAPCPVCGSELTKEKLAHVAKERTAKIEAARKRITELQSAIATAKKQFEGISSAVKSSEVAEVKIAILLKNSGELEGLKKKMLVLQANLLKIISDREKLNREVSGIAKQNQLLAVEINEVKSILSKKRQLGNEELQLSQTDAELAKIEYSEKDYEASRKELESKRIFYEKCAGEMKTMEGEIKSLKDLLQEISGEINSMEQMEIEIKVLIELEEEMVVYKNILAETQVTLRAELSEAINAAMNEIWHIFYPYRDLKAVRLNVTEKDYLLEVYDNSWKQIEGVCSGGERACAALTLRVALAMVLTPNLSMLILDEPTHNLDKDAVELLSQTLQFKVPEVVQQTFVITHEEALMGSEFAATYRLTRDKENFGETKIERV